MRIGIGKRLVSLVIVAGLAWASAQQPFVLQVIHSSDNESAFQDPNTLEERILHYSALVEGLRTLVPEGQSLYLTAGDHTLPGPFYQAAEQVPSLGARGLGDIAIFNAGGLVANAIGNHEFDGGIADFARMLFHAEYPFIAANLDFSQVRLPEGVPPIVRGVDGGSVQENAGKVVRSAYVEVAGERIGIIGRAPADFFNVIAAPDETVPGLDFIGGRTPEDNQPRVSALSQVLEQVDLLASQGIDKIILLDHAQDYTGDPLSAQSLRGIDIVVAAGSTGFMARPEATGPFNLLRAGDQSGASYPTLRLDSEGRLVAVVNSDQLYRYVGNLIVEFDEDGHLVRIDPRSGPIASTEEAVEALDEVIGTRPTPPQGVVEVFTALQSTPLIREAFEVLGTTDEPLDGDRAHVRSMETNLGRLAANSTLWYARQAFPDMRADIALKNGGGIRGGITGPNITRLAVSTALAFDNKIALVQVTGEELLAAMENAVSRVPALDGRFPQLAGMELVFDTSRPGVSDSERLSVPSRVHTLTVSTDEGEVTLVEDYQVVGDLSRTFGLATNSFLLTGGDGYRSLLAASEARGAVETDVGEQQVFAEYLGQLGGEVRAQDLSGEPRVRQVEAVSQQ